MILVKIEPDNTRRFITSLKILDRRETTLEMENLEPGDYYLVVEMLWEN